MSPVGGSAALVAERVISVRFSIDGPQVGLRLTSRQYAGGRPVETTLHTQVLLRNQGSDQ